MLNTAHFIKDLLQDTCLARCGEKYSRDGSITERPFHTFSIYIDCSEEAFNRITSFSPAVNAEVGRLLRRTDQDEIWIGENDYWIDQEGLIADPDFLMKNGYVKAEIRVDYREEDTNVLDYPNLFSFF